MGHIKYRKIRRLGTPETEGILNGDVIVQEKVDGANLSIWMEDGEIYVGSRTQTVGSPKTNKGFRGAVEYVKKHKGINKLLEENPGWRLCGEWLVKHTISYPAQYMNRFWMFDIQIGGDEKTPIFLNPIETNKIAKEMGIYSPYIFGKLNNPSLEDIAKFLDEPNYGEHIEGVVLKNMDFINTFGNGCYGKIVKESFKEANGVIFGNVNRNSSSEKRIASKYVTPGRVLKIIHKIEQSRDVDFNSSNISEALGRVNYDVVSEEIMSIIKKHTIINFNSLTKEINNTASSIILSYLEGEDSLIFNPENIEYIKEE